MNIKTMTQEEIRRVGLEALANTLGPVVWLGFSSYLKLEREITQKRGKCKASVKELVEEIRSKGE
jgi:hypothetical protein